MTNVNDVPKKKVSISIDPNVWAEAKLKLGNCSAFIEEQLNTYLRNDLSEERELLKLIEEKNAELSILEGKLCKLREARLTKINQLDIFEAPMISLNRLHDGLGHVGKNQIKAFAHKNDVPYDALLEHVIDSGLNVVNFAEVAK